MTTSISTSIPTPILRIVQITQEIQDLERIQALAESTGKTGDAVKAVERIGRLREEAGRLRRSNEIEQITDEVEQLRAKAKLATDEGSWIAAEKFSSSAMHLELERRRIELETAQLEFAEMSVDELANNLLELIPELSLDVQLRLLQKVSECVKH